MDIKKTLVALLSAGLISSPAFSAHKNAGSAGAKAPFSTHETNMLFVDVSSAKQVAGLSVQEMKDTEGAVAPLVAIGVMTAGRFIVQRWVTQATARALVRRGATNVLAPTRQVAARIAGRGRIREFHAGPGARYTHFHPASRNGSHVWYGRPR